MKNWTYDELTNNGYKIENAKITSVDLSMADHGVMTLSLVLEGSGWGVVYGGYVIGKGYLGCDDNYIAGSASGMESLIRIMLIIGVERFQDLKNKYVRVASKGWGDSIKIIGNVMKDQWFDIDSFFKDEKENNNE